MPGSSTTIGNVNPFMRKMDDILFVVYTERVKVGPANAETEVVRLISARMATNFERGIYYGKYE